MVIVTMVLVRFLEEVSNHNIPLNTRPINPLKLPPPPPTTFITSPWTHTMMEFGLFMCFKHSDFMRTFVSAAMSLVTVCVFVFVFVCVCARVCVCFCVYLFFCLHKK